MPKKKKSCCSSIRKLEVDNPTNGLPNSRLVTHTRELNITCKPQCKEIRTSNLTTDYGKNTDKWKWKKHIIINFLFLVLKKDITKSKYLLDIVQNCKVHRLDKGETIFHSKTGACKWNFFMLKMPVLNNLASVVLTLWVPGAFVIPSNYN
jgi:hypothetical protein